MIRVITYFIGFYLLCHSGIAFGQDTDRKIEFPDIPGFQTLICDFHIHTVLSDGSVWPNIRIEEAVRDGLDAISLTDHLEYQPHSADIPHPDRNRSFELAKEYAKPYDLIVVHGSEITRDMPPGHANAIFITDANALNIPDSIEAYREARRQGAFIFWNHPNWISQQENGIPFLSELHQFLIDEGLLHGIEVVNDLTYSEEALEIALDKNLTVMGTSDIHGLVDWQYEVDKGGHRPVCLVFAEERSEASIKEALFAGRTVAWFENILVGKADHLVPLVESSISVKNKGFIGPSQVLELVLTNNSDARYLLKHNGPYTFYNHSSTIALPAHGKITLQILTRSDDENIDLTFEVLNAVSGLKKNPVIVISGG